jgi:hypothetical protein
MASRQRRGHAPRSPRRWRDAPARQPGPAAEMLELKGVGTVCFTESPALLREVAGRFLARHASRPRGGPEVAHPVPGCGRRRHLRDDRWRFPDLGVLVLLALWPVDLRCLRRTRRNFDDDRFSRRATGRPGYGIRQALLLGANRPESLRHRYRHRVHRQASDAVLDGRHHLTDRSVSQA